MRKLRLTPKWRNFAVAASVLVLVAGLGRVELRPIDLPTYQELKGPEANYRPGGSDCDPAQLKRLAGRDAANERERCADAAEDYRLKRNELTQQSRSADAQVAVAVITYRQTALLLVGTILGLLTLGAAIYAAYYAKRAAEAAEKDLAHSRHGARPYLSSEEESVSIEPEIVILTHKLRNTGTTPAHGLTGEYTAEFVYRSGGHIPIANMVWNNGTAGPGSPIEVSYQMRIDKREIDAFNEKTGQIYAHLEAFYVNGFGERWIYAHEFRIDVDMIGKTAVTVDCSQYPCEDGEEPNHGRLL